MDLLAFAGIASLRFPVYPVTQHLAEKLHAYSMARERENTRTKDLVDIVVMCRVRRWRGTRCCVRAVGVRGAGDARAAGAAAAAAGVVGEAVRGTGFGHCFAHDGAMGRPRARGGVLGSNLGWQRGGSGERRSWGPGSQGRERGKTGEPGSVASRSLKGRS